MHLSQKTKKSIQNKDILNIKIGTEKNQQEKVVFSI